jgi:hypothetical protein
MPTMDPDEDPLRPHSHDPNPEPPLGDGAFRLSLPDGREVAITPAELRALPRSAVANCFIVSTGHGTSGPFTFSGVRLLDLVVAFHPAGWSQAEVISADGFGNRVTAGELLAPHPAGPILLADEVDGRPLSRAQGLVRLIVPSESDDALRQVKWIGRINVR